MRSRGIALAAMLAMAPFGARAADLVVWWEEGQSAEENEAVREIIAAFEQNTGKQVELVLGKQEQIAADLMAAIEAGRRTPDFVFTVADTQPYEQWAYEGRLVELTDVVGHFADLFDPDALERMTLLNGTTGQRGLYLLPMGLATHHLHAWKSLLERAGFTLADVPKEWDAFWSFWCDQVQPAVRKALGREDVWGVGLPMAAASVDTENGIWQFIHAYEANYVTQDGRLVIDDPEVRRRLIKAVDSYTAIYRKGCTPPNSVSWDGYGNNAQFLAQSVVMTPNQTLSTPEGQRASIEPLVAACAGKLFPGLDRFYLRERVRQFIGNGIALYEATTPTITPMLDREWLRSRRWNSASGGIASESPNWRRSC
jgi:multiple sugar transport system substrate-binding protein